MRRTNDPVFVLSVALVTAGLTLFLVCLVALFHYMRWFGL